MSEESSFNAEYTPTTIAESKLYKLCRQHKVETNRLQAKKANEEYIKEIFGHLRTSIKKKERSESTVTRVSIVMHLMAEHLEGNSVFYITHYDDELGLLSKVDVDGIYENVTNAQPDDPDIIKPERALSEALKQCIYPLAESKLKNPFTTEDKDGTIYNREAMAAMVSVLFDQPRQAIVVLQTRQKEGKTEIGWVTMQRVK